MYFPSFCIICFYIISPKRKCGLGLIMTKLRITTEYVVAMSILLLNLRKVLSAFLNSFFNWAFLPYPSKISLCPVDIICELVKIY